ncbi:hypothetical protein L873DRAFT_1848078 [Choiromyces venosus 120613-1]|uniref:Uncharacterized protein n=1 Tax=Choiromyces venosus 120613-1 TaxID=1336337 RepID=A0A3N4J3Y1_9PEZI|nr:hypothetical protein L873DRAFT_1848078 [Choiromyces venosus 120613-1]
MPTTRYSLDRNPYSSFKRKVQLNDNEHDYLDNLACNCLKPQTLLLVMELLVQISHHKISGQPEQPSLVSLVPAPLKEGASLLEQDMIPRALATAQRAHEYITKCSFDAYEARLRLMLAYITLHLTLEYIITPFLIKENSEMNTRQIKGLKWKFFFEKLGGQKGLGCKLQKLKDNVGYGKILWTWVTDCGIVWLPTLASLDRAITIFIKANPLNSMHSKVVGNKLATQEIWAAFSKAMAPVVLNLLFSITSPPFTMSDLLRLYFHQPQINQSATRFREVIMSSNYNEILYTMADQEPNLILFQDCIKGTIFESLDIEPTQTPTICYPPTQVTKVNLINWVLNAGPDMVLQLNCRNNFEAGPVSLQVLELASLFSPSCVTRPVITFLTRLWNNGAIAGWLCLSIENGETLMSVSAPTTLCSALQIILRTESSLEHIKYVVLPVEKEHTYYVFVCCPQEKSVCILYWLFAGNTDVELKEMIEEVSNIEVFVGWEVSIEMQDPTTVKEPLSKRNIALLMLYLLRYSIVRSRLPGDEGEEEPSIDINDIILECLRAAYSEGINEGECVLPYRLEVA